MNLLALFKPVFPGYFHHHTKTLLIMKLTAALLLFASLQVSASAYSQKVTISVHNAPLEKVFKDLGRQTGYLFFFTDEMLQKARPVTIDVRNVSLEEALDICFKDQPLVYSVSQKTIVLHSVEKRPLIETPPPAPAPGQDISGMVKDESGKAIGGASVVIRELKLGTETNGIGAFFLRHIPIGTYTIEISFVGYEPMRRKITTVDHSGPTDVYSTLNIVFTLKKADSKLNEVVVTGYSSKTAGELTGSVQRISGDVIRSGITSSDVSSMLQGRVTGMYITNQAEGDPTATGGGILLRGVSSVAGLGIDKYNEYVLPSTTYGPLIVVDGVIMPRETSPGQSLTLKDVVNPNDIASITTLKDASATAIYGSRASAGVIVITTKRGKSDGLHLNLDLKYGANVPNRGNIRFLSGPELYNYQKLYYTENWNNNQQTVEAQYGVNSLDDYLNIILPSLQTVQDTDFDYQKYGFLTSYSKQINLSASGGTDKTRYYLGIGYYNEQSTGIDNGLARKTFRINIDNNFSKRLSFSASINGIFDDGTRDNSNFGSSSYQLIPWVYPLTASGAPKSQLDYTLGGYPTTAPNFLYDKQYNYNTLRNQQLFGSLRINVNFTDWLSASSTNSFNLGYNKNELYTDARSYYGVTFGTNGGLTDNSSYYNSELTSNVLTFHKKWGDHSIKLLAGQEFGTSENESNGINVIGLKPGYHVINLAQNIGNIYGYSNGIKNGNILGDEYTNAVFSGFGELGYDYKDKYYISGSARTDASTNFGPNKRYATFYSGGASWIISKEAFLQGSGAVNEWKLRANYGTSGSQNGNNFFTQTLYNPGLTYGGQSAAVIASLGNPDIGWETTRSLDAGTDFSLFHDRVSGSVDYYNRLSIGLIQKVSLTGALGFAGQYQNSGNVSNKGWEVLLNTVNIKTRDFRWTTDFNITFNKNRLEKAYGDSLNISTEGYYIRQGEDVNSVKAIKEVGVDPASGNPLYQKLIFDSKGHVTGSQTVQSIGEVLSEGDDRQYQNIGSLQPKYFGGITNTFTYKHVSLSVLLYFQSGNLLFNQDRFDFQMNSVTSYNQIAYIKGQSLWTTPGQKNATEPSLYAQANGDWWNSLNSHFYDNGSYLRVRNIRLSYDLTGSFLKKAGITQAQVYASGDNLFTFTHKGFLGSDPSGEYAGDAFQQSTGGVGFGLGTPRKYLLGLNVTF
jgi:TonB-linked SusC/RagA family outer membrane protein